MAARLSRYSRDPWLCAPASQRVYPCRSSFQCSYQYDNQMNRASRDRTLRDIVRFLTVLQPNDVNDICKWLCDNEKEDCVGPPEGVQNVQLRELEEARKLREQIAKLKAEEEHLRARPGRHDTKSEKAKRPLAILTSWGARTFDPHFASSTVEWSFLMNIFEAQRSRTVSIVRSGLNLKPRERVTRPLSRVLSDKV